MRDKVPDTAGTIAKEIFDLVKSQEGSSHAIELEE